jgi:hypothetical protein
VQKYFKNFCNPSLKLAGCKNILKIFATILALFASLYMGDIWPV